MGVFWAITVKSTKCLCIEKRCTDEWVIGPKVDIEKVTFGGSTGTSAYDFCESNPVSCIEGLTNRVVVWFMTCILYFQTILHFWRENYRFILSASWQTIKTVINRCCNFGNIKRMSMVNVSCFLFSFVCFSFCLVLFVYVCLLLFLFLHWLSRTQSLL